jgi:hypothetical protein
MKFIWDEAQNETNIRKHGLDFADAHEVFDGPILKSLMTVLTMGRNGGLPWGFCMASCAWLWFVPNPEMKPYG